MPPNCTASQLVACQTGRRFSVRIEVGDPDGKRFEAVDAIVDTGATRTTIPASLLRALGVEAYRQASFRLADGTIRELGLGRTRVRVDGRAELTQVAFAEEGMPALLGAITMEELDLAVDPVNRRLVPTTGLLL